MKKVRCLTGLLVLLLLFQATLRRYSSMFGKREVSREEFVTLRNRVTELEEQIEKMHTALNSLRGLVNRKLQLEIKEEEFKKDDGFNALRF